MNEFGSMSREDKKRQLRRQVVTPGQPVPSGSGPGPGRNPSVRPHPAREEAADREESARQAYRRARRRRLFVVLLIAALIAGAAGYWFYYQRNYQYKSYETAWQVTLNEGSLVSYEPFGDNVLRCTKDGASYIDLKGATVWTESYEMKNPIVDVNGPYAAIADRQGNTIYICNTDGRQGQATTVLPISRVAVSKTGVVAAVLEDSISSYITFFKKDGSTLDLTVKTTMGGDGYPLDIALSDDGTQLLSSYAFLENGELKERVVFYDFSEVGKNVPRRVVGGFDKDYFDGTLVPEVTYMETPYSCAFSGNGLTFFSSRNIASPTVVTQVPIAEEIQSVFYSEEYAAVIVRTAAGEYASRLEVYKKDGTPVMEKEFTYEYTHADIDGDLILLYNEDSCRIFNMAGVEKLYATFDFTVSRIRKGRVPDTLVITGPQQMREIKLR